MFWTRSEYFRALIDDHFHEGRWDTQTDRLVIPINNISPEVFAVVVSHIYSNLQQVLQLYQQSRFQTGLRTNPKTAY